jgi:hypothetical protein
MAAPQPEEEHRMAAETAAIPAEAIRAVGIQVVTRVAEVPAVTLAEAVQAALVAGIPEEVVPRAEAAVDIPAEDHAAVAAGTAINNLPTGN